MKQPASLAFKSAYYKKTGVHREEGESWTSLQFCWSDAEGCQMVYGETRDRMLDIQDQEAEQDHREVSIGVSRGSDTSGGH